MATVLPPAPAPSKVDARLEQELGKATGRIRLNDLLTGGLALAALTLAYAAAAVLLDRWLDLPEWVRQLMLGGFAVASAAVGYLLLVRPMWRRVNPRFAARRVEETIPDAKNVLINWVDLREQDLPPGVRTAVGAKAAEGVAGADVNKAVESKRVVWLGAAVGLLFAVLAVLVVLFKPAPFLSLVSRTFNPFTPTRIATKTDLTITEPAGGDVTVTAGDPVTVTVHVGGSVPDPDGPDRVRLRVRYNPDAAEFDEVPFEPGGAAREWVLRVPQSVVQNGFWYRVAAGDAETPEYRVTVRSRPLFKEYEARYEYPAYTRMKPEVGHEPQLWAYEGTEVTLTAKANRPVKRGWMQIDGQPQTIPGEVVGEARDALRFKLTLAKDGSYRLWFTTTADETSEPTPSYPIKVTKDQKPTVTITTPAEAEVTLPANGLLKVDGVIGDDFGVASATLKLQLPGAKEPLVARKYRDGKSFKRKADGSYPTTVEYKDSVPLAELKGADGQPLPENTTVEYWLEATDNAPTPQTGTSAKKKLRLGPPEKQEQAKEDQQQRKSEEQQHRTKQDQQFQNENRQPPQQHQENPENAGEQKTGQQGQPGQQGEQPKTGQQSGRSDNPDKGNPDSKQTPNPMTGNAGTDQANPDKHPTGAQNPMQKTGEQQPDPRQNPGATQQPPDKTPMGEQGSNPDHKQGATPPNNQSNPPDTKQNPEGGSASQQQAGDRQIDQKANELANAIKQQERQPGEARNQDLEQQKPEATPADKKPGTPPQNGAQAEPKAGQPTDSQGHPMNGGSPSADSKGQGNLEQPKPSEEKPQPKPAGGNPPQQPNQQGNPDDTTGSAQKSEPVGGNPGQEKPGSQGTEPKSPMNPSAGSQAGEKSPKPGDMRPSDPGAARGPEQATKSEKSPGGTDTPNHTEPKSAPSAGERKGAPESGRAQERPMPNQGAADTQTNPEERPAEARGVKPTDPAKSKQGPGNSSQPNQAPGATGKPDPAQAKPTPGQVGSDPKQAPAAAKPDGTKQPDKTGPKPSNQGAGSPEQGTKPNETATGAANPKANEKPVPSPGEKSSTQDGSARPEKNPKATGSGGEKPKVDPKELEQAAKDLASGDPQKQQAARDKLDKMIGKDAREQAEREAKQLQDDLKSGDPNRRAAAQKKIEEMAKQAGQQANQGGERRQPSKEEMEQWAKKAQDLTSDDPAKREAAEKDFDKAIGEEQRKQLQKDARDLKSGDPQTRQAAEQRMTERVKNAAGGEPGRQPSKEEFQKWAQKAQDLASNDPEKRAAAEKDFDQAIGKERRQQLQEAAKDRFSSDPKTRDAADQQIDQAAKDAAQKGSPSGSDQSHMPLKLMDTLRDLNSNDPAKKQAAEETVRKAAERLKDLNSKDPAKKQAAEKEQERLKGAVRDLASDDPAKRKAAEKELDEKLGKQLRDELQEYSRFTKDTEDAKSKDPQKAAEAQKRMEEWAKNNPAVQDWMKKFRPNGGDGGRGPDGKTIEGDPRNRLKTAELQLQQFEKNRNNKELQEKLGYTPEEYEKFLEAYRRRVTQMRDEVAKQEREGPQPTGPATQNVSEGSGGRKLETRPDGTTGTTGSAGPGTAPPGYTDAQRKFAEEAAKRRRGQEKK